MDGVTKQQNDKIVRNDVHVVTLKEQPTIYSLNNDCLECIFERVPNLANQIQIAKSCHRFHDVMLGLWRRQPKHRILAFNVLPTILVNYGDLKYYLTTMRTEFHTVQIIDDCLNVFLREMEDCDIQCFPCVERFEFHNHLTDCYPSDNDMDALSKLVPNLKSLQIAVPITGKYLTNFQYLEELHMYDMLSTEKQMEVECLRDILLNLKHLRVLDLRTFEMSQLRLIPEIAQCTTLEILKLNLNTLKNMLHYVLQLPKLKQLTVLLDQDVDTTLTENLDAYDLKRYETQEYHQILQLKGPQIKGIAVDFGYLPVSSTWPMDFGYLQAENLKLLSLCNSHFYVNEYSECHFARLEILCLRHTQNIQAPDILEMLHLCPVLKHLDISYCFDLDISLLNDIVNYLEKEKRQQVLCLYYHMSGMDYEIEKNISYWGAQTNVKLVNDLPPDSDDGLSYVHRGYAFYF